MKFKPLVCEFIGAFALCFSGFLAVHNMGRSHELGGLLMVAFAFGLPIVCLGSAFGAISGAHFNPAVTLGLLVVKKIDLVSAIGYIIVQLLGAYAASMASGYNSQLLAAEVLVHNGQARLARSRQTYTDLLAPEIRCLD